MKQFVLILALCTMSFAQYDRCDTSFVGNDTAVVCTSFFSSDNVEAVRRYVNGKRDGYTRTYYNNGQLSGLLNYKNGCLVDTVKEYHPNGAEKSIAPYKDCHYHGTILEWDSTGFQTAIIPYHHGKRVGTHKYWYPDGKLKSTESFDSIGQSDGLTAEYYPNGQMHWEAKYLQGRKLEVKKFWEDGKLAHEKEWFEDGKRLKNAKYFSPEGKPLGEIKDGNGSFTQCVPNFGCWKFLYENGKEVRKEKISTKPSN